MFARVPYMLARGSRCIYWPLTFPPSFLRPLSLHPHQVFDPKNCICNGTGVSKDKDVISIFLKGNDYNKILSYLDVICLKSLFGKEGLNVAIKILQNPKIRPSLEKKVGKDYYKALESLVIDEIGDSPFSVSKLN